jgi:hypothetical protein
LYVVGASNPAFRQLRRLTYSADTSRTAF